MPFIVKIIVKICLDESHETKKKKMTEMTYIQN